MPFQFTTPQPTHLRLPVKDAVRSMRFAVRRGRIGPIKLPAPLLHPGSETVGRAIHQLEVLTSGLAHSLLDERPTSDGWQSKTIDDIDRHERADIVFAESAYKGLKAVLRSLGARDCLVSEVYAAEAYRAVALSAGAGGSERYFRAAALVHEMVERGVVVDVILGSSPQQGGRTGEVGIVAPFALVLWLFGRSGSDDSRVEGMIDSAAQISRVLTPQIVANLHNREALRDLIEFYADKL